MQKSYFDFGFPFPIYDIRSGSHIDRRDGFVSQYSFPIAPHPDESFPTNYVQYALLFDPCRALIGQSDRRPKCMWPLDCAVPGNLFAASIVQRKAYSWSSRMFDQFAALCGALRTRFSDFSAVRLVTLRHYRTASLRMTLTADLPVH